MLQVSFKPDLAKFKMTHLDTDTVSLMTRRAYDIAGCTKGVTVHLNGAKLPVRTSHTHVHMLERLHEYRLCNPPNLENLQMHIA